MLRLLPDLPESSNNNDNFELQKLKKDLQIQLIELGVDTDYLSQNFVLFDVKKYNDSDIKEEDVIEQTINFLTNAKTLLESIQYFKQSTAIENIIDALNKGE